MNITLDEGAYFPEHAYENDAGYDLRTPKAVCIPAHGSAEIDTGVHFEIPHGYVGMVKSKSGLNFKHNLICDGVIDSDYRGSVRCKLYNLGEDAVVLPAGAKVTQIVFLPCMTPSLLEVDALNVTERGNKGFGSTGV